MKFIDIQIILLEIFDLTTALVSLCHKMPNDQMKQYWKIRIYVESWPNKHPVSKEKACLKLQKDL